MLMRSQIPFYRQINLYAAKIKKIAPKTPSIKPTTKLLSSPKMLTKFAPVSPMIRHSPHFSGKAKMKPDSILSKLSGNPGKKKVEELKGKPSKGTLSNHKPYINATDSSSLTTSSDINTEVIRLPNTAKAGHKTETEIPDASELLKSPSLFLRDTGKDEAKGIIYCECGNPCKEGNTLCENCLKSKESIEHCGYLYVQNESKQFQRYWYILLNKELYGIFK